MSRPHTGRRLMTAALVSGGVAASVLGVAGQASAAEPSTGIGVEAHVGGLSASVHADGLEPPGDDGQGDDGQGDDGQGDDGQGDDDGGETPPPDDPTTPPTDPSTPPTDPSTPPTEPSDGGDGDHGGSGGAPPSSGIGEGQDTTPDGPSAGGCEGNSLSCTDDVPAPEEPDVQQGRAVPADTQAESAELAHTGADGLEQAGLLGAGLLGAGGLMVARHYRGRHRRAT